MDPADRWQDKAMVRTGDMFVERYLFNQPDEEKSGVFRVHSLCHSFFKPEYNFSSAPSAWHLISIVLNGRLTKEHRPSDRIPVHTFSVVDLSDSNSPHLVNKGDVLERYFILMKSGTLLQPLMLSLFGSEQVSFEPDDPERLERCFEEAGDLLASGVLGGQAELDSLVFRLLAEAAEQKRNGSSDAVTDKAAAYIRAHFRDPELNRNEIARASGCCISLLSHRFREKMNCTLRNYITNLRLERARQMLSVTDRQISEIAQECGYSLPYHFSGEFRRKYGSAPLKYRKRNQIGGRI